MWEPLAEDEQVKSEVYSDDEEVLRDSDDNFVCQPSINSSDPQNSNHEEETKTIAAQVTYLAPSKYQIENVQDKSQDEYCCFQCEKRYSSMFSLKQHMKTHQLKTILHSNKVKNSSMNDPLKVVPLNCCPYCGMEDVSLVSHLNTCTVAASPNLPLPPGTFVEEIKSENLDTKPVESICQICDPERNCPATLKHNRCYHSVSSDDIVPCYLCWEWFLTLDDMEYHLQFHGKNPKFLHCKMCTKKFTSQTGYGKIMTWQKGLSKDSPGIKVGQQCLDEHIKSHNQELKCDQCGKTCRGIPGLKQHLKTHNKQHPCEICGKFFQAPAQVRYHMEEKHNKGQHYSCDQCEKSFNSPFGLKQHVKTHQPKTIVCDICAKVFHTKGKLQSHHQQVHTENRPFKCDFEGCNAAFTTNTQLITHQRMHTGERPYKCSSCEATFKRSDHLKKHNMIHTGERPHVCPHCGDGFIQINNMKTHRNTCSKKYGLT